MGTNDEDIKGIQDFGRRGNRNAARIGGQNGPVTVVSDEDFSVPVFVARSLFGLLGRWYYPFHECLAGASSIGAVIAILAIDNFGHGLNNTAFNINLVHYVAPFMCCLVMFVFSLSMISVSSDSTCPQCREPFRMFETHRELLNKSAVENQTVYVFTVHEKCNNCGHKRHHPHEEVVDI